MDGLSRRVGAEPGDHSREPLQVRGQFKRKELMPYLATRDPAEPSTHACQPSVLIPLDTPS